MVVIRFYFILFKARILYYYKTVFVVMNLLIYFSLLLLIYSCSDSADTLQDSESISCESKVYPIINDGVVYPSTSNVQTRISYSDEELDWVNGTKVTLPSGEKVDLPWVDGGSLPFFMQTKLSPDNGWELIAHTMYPDNQSDKSYMFFHNYITGTLRVFCYMSTFAPNNNGYWKLSFSQPNKLMNFTGKVALFAHQETSLEVYLTNSTTQPGKGFALGWNGFQLELSYDSDAKGIMKVEPMNFNVENTVINGDFTSSTEGTIVGNPYSVDTPLSKAVAGIGKLAGSEAEKWLQSKYPEIEGKKTRISASLFSLASAGVTSLFKSFSGLFKKQSQEILDVNLTTNGSIHLKGVTVMPTAAPIVPVNLHLEMIDGDLGGWNIFESPKMTWWTTAFNEMEQNLSVTNREYIYEVPQPQFFTFTVESNPKARINSRKLRYVFIRSTDLYSYTKQGNVEYGSNVFSASVPQYSFQGTDVINQLRMRVHVRHTDYPTSEGIPFIVDFLNTNELYKIVEYVEKSPRMNVFVQFICNQDFVINGMTNQYISSRTYEMTEHNWGDAY